MVLVDSAAPWILEDATLLLGPDGATILAPSDGSMLGLRRAPTIVHLLFGSPSWKVCVKQLSAPSTARNAAAFRIIVHHAPALHGDPGDPLSPIRDKGFLVFAEFADSKPAFDDPPSSRWARAAALGRFYLKIGLDATASRSVAMAVAGMEVAASCAPTRPDQRASVRLTERVDQALLGIPCVTLAPNAAFSQPYLADRQGLQLTVRQSQYLGEQPLSFWPHREEASGRVLMPRQQALEDLEQLVVLDDRLFDLAVGTPMVAVRRLSDGSRGYVTLDMLVAKCEGDGREIWVGARPDLLRPCVEFRNRAGALYSTNLVGPKERESSFAFLARFSNQDDDLSVDAPHPLQVGAHAHRLGVWALDERRDPKDRAEVARLFAGTLDRYIAPKAMEIAPGAVGWPYEFDFRMPWATALRPPWFGGYSGAAMLGTLAVGWALTGEARWKDLARGALGYLHLPSEKGGAAYWIDGFQFSAEYAYRTAPIPNYRVLDGELCSPQYLYNAGLLLDEPEIVSLAHRLACGLTAPLRLLRRSDGAPLFGMDGQDMNPNYMWQLWMCLQLLAAMTKDRTFAKLARDWRPFIPESFGAEGYPL